MAERPSDHRRFPRAKERIPVQLTIRTGGREFSAMAYSVDISLTGIFFASTFFLKPGVELDCEFKVPNDERTVRTHGVIVREVRADKPGMRSGVSGFAVQFTDYYDDAKTALAASFLMVELGDFVGDYLRRRTKKARNEPESLADAIIAWEVSKMSIGGAEQDLLHARLRLDANGRIRRRDATPAQQRRRQ